MSRTLHFLINDEDQGCAVDNLPKGAFRLACCMQFKEQRVVISRFWTSLGRDGTVPKTQSTMTLTADKDKIGKEHEKEDDDLNGGDTVNVEAPQQTKEMYADYKEPVIDPDAPLFGDDYGVEPQEEDDDDDDESDYVVAESEDDDDVVPDIELRLCIEIMLCLNSMEMNSENIRFQSVFWREIPEIKYRCFLNL